VRLVIRGLAGWRCAKADHDAGQVLANSVDRNRFCDLSEVAGNQPNAPAFTQREIAHSAEGALSEARSAGKRTVLLRLKSGDSMRFLTAPVG
jgi:hypothetical protein